MDNPKEEFEKIYTELLETIISYNDKFETLKKDYINKYKKFNEDDHVVYKDSNIDYYITDGLPGVDKYGNILYDIHYWDDKDYSHFEFNIDQDNLILNENDI